MAIPDSACYEMYPPEETSFGTDPPQIVTTPGIEWADCPGCGAKLSRRELGDPEAAWEHRPA